MSKRNNSTDSGLISSEAAVKEQTFVKHALPSPNNEDNNPYQNQQGPTFQQRPRSLSGTNRASFHDYMPTGAGSKNAGQKNDSDTDQGIVPDVTKLLVGNRPLRRPKSASSPTYSIHINSLYVYQQPTIPFENPLYQQLPVHEKADETPPSPCQPQQTYQYLWKGNQEGMNYPAQHSYESSTARYTSQKLASSTSTEPCFSSEEKYSSHKTRQHVDEKKAKRIPHFAIPTDSLAEATDMEVMIRDKAGKSRRYKLQPLDEDRSNYVMETSDGGRVFVEGISISDKEETKDEAFSEAGSFPESISVSTIATSGTSSSAAIDTVVGDCKLTVEKTYQPSSLEDGHDDNIGETLPTSHIISGSVSKSNLQDQPSNRRSLAESTPAVNLQLSKINQPKSMHDPTYFDFAGTKILDNSDKHGEHISGLMSKSVPNIAISSRIDTCYECRNQKRRLFSRQRIPRECTLEGYHYVTDDNEIAFMKEVLNNEGKPGHWFITPLSNQPGYKSCLYVKTKREVTSFPVVQNKKEKLFLDFNLKKTFSCLCKLTEYYKSTHLPEVKINLGHPLPKEAFPDMSYGADGSGTLMGQYVGVKL